MTPDTWERMVTAALRAHWPSFNNMRPDNARAWRKKMELALRAAFAEQRP